MKRLEVGLYTFVRAVVVGFCKLYFRVSYEGLENVPSGGAFLLTPVHRSNVDTLVASGVTRRRMRFLGKDSMWKIKPIGKVFDVLGAIPVHRGVPDRESLKACMAALSSGEPVVVYPEGQRRKGPLVTDLFEGAAYMAIRAGVPMVPVGIGGSADAMRHEHRLPRPKKIVVIVGKPLDPPTTAGGSHAPRRAIRELSQQLEEALQRVFDEAQSRVST